MGSAVQHPVSRSGKQAKGLRDRERLCSLQVQVFSV